MQVKVEGDHLLLAFGLAEVVVVVFHVGRCEGASREVLVVQLEVLVNIGSLSNEIRNFEINFDLGQAVDSTTDEDNVDHEHGDAAYIRKKFGGDESIDELLSH